jgi:hypothetical protein
MKLSREAFQELLIILQTREETIMFIETFATQIIDSLKLKYNIFGGYVTHENRTEASDRYFIRAARNKSLTESSIKNWLGSSLSRRFMDEYSDRTPVPAEFMRSIEDNKELIKDFIRR